MKQMEGMSFSVSPEQALDQFDKWASRDQGIRSMMSWDSVRIAAAYVPVWSFDLNVRFRLDNSFAWKPSIFEPYQKEPIVYVSGLSCYAGHTYRRSLLNPIHNTALVFLGDQTQPFDRWMLRDMKLSNGQVLQIVPDPWNATKHRCLEIVQQDLLTIAQSEEPSADVQVQLVRARRVYLPTYVIEYSILGVQYEAFVSGCDEGSGVSGVNHAVWSNDQTGNFIPSPSFVGNVGSIAQTGARVFGTRGMLGAATVILQFAGSLLARVATRIPAVAVLGGIFVGFRKIVQPWLDQRSSTADWEQEREREASGHNQRPYVGDDFDDYTGAGERYFRQNKQRILRHMMGSADHQQGDYDWYKDWEAWARQQFEQQQQQQQQSYYQQQQQSYSRQRQQSSSSSSSRQTKSKPNYKWGFDPNDPYAVLGVKRGSTSKEVAAAFRREMLKYHPDTQVNASEAERDRSTERSKLITDAYRKIKAEQKANR